MSDIESGLGLSPTTRFHYRIVHRRYYDDIPYSIGYEFPDSDEGRGAAERKLRELTVNFLRFRQILPDPVLGIDKVEEGQSIRRRRGNPSTYDYFHPPEEPSIITETHTHESQVT